MTFDPRERQRQEDFRLWRQIGVRLLIAVMLIVILISLAQWMGAKQ